jgi:5-oxoprolinase (ATP-hydrolysing) subunit A
MGMTMSIDLNCDLGEGMPNDEQLMAFISSANIACGYHAGDATIMKRTIEHCLRHNVQVGAHPGFNDKANFGRTEIKLSDNALYDLIADQLQVMHSACLTMGAALHHVKPHGALYNMAAKDRRVSSVIAKAVKEFDSSLILYGLSGSFLITEAKEFGIDAKHEVFADRTYQEDGSLTPRNLKNALITDTDQSLAQVIQMIERNEVMTVEGKSIPIQADTICLHGDGAHAVDFAKAVYNHLQSKGITIKAPSHG